MRVVNFRFAVMILSAIIFGIVITVSVLVAKYLLFALLLTVFIILLFIVAFKRKFTALLLLIVSIMTSLLTYIDSRPVKYFDDNIIDGVVVGYVSDQSSFYDNYVRLILRDVTVYYDDRQVNIKGMLSATVFVNGSSFDVGDRLTLSGAVTAQNLISGNTINSWEYRNGIELIMTDCVLNDIQDAKPTLAEMWRKKLKENLFKFIPENADIIYALITGDKSLMQDEDKDALRRAGIIHILTVSGLHVSFLTGALMFVLKKLRLNFAVTFSLTAVVAFAYAYLCGFPPSVLRAVIMVLTMEFSSRLHSRNDMLSSIAISAILILLFKPLFIFDAGFLLSYSAVFGICCQVPLTRRLLLRFDNANKVVKHLLGTAMTTIFVSISTLPAVAYFYGEVPLLGLLTNIIALPIVEVVYISSIVTVFIPYVNYALAIPNLLIQFVLMISHFVSNLSFATVTVAYLGIASIAYFAILFVIGGFVNVKGKLKIITMCCLALICAVVGVAVNVPENTQFALSVIDYYNEPYITLTDDKGTLYVVGDITSTALADSIVTQNDKYAIDKIIIVTTNAQNILINAVNVLNDFARIEKVYVFGNTGNSNLQSTYTVVNLPIWESVNETISFTILDNGNSGILKIKASDMTVLLLTEQCDYSLENIKRLIDKDIDYFVVPQYLASDIAETFEYITVICPFQINVSNIYGVNEYGNFTISKESGKMLKIF